MFGIIAKMLYVDIKEHRLKLADPSNEMDDLKQTKGGDTSIQLNAKDAAKPNKKKCC